MDMDISMTDVSRTTTQQYTNLKQAPQQQMKSKAGLKRAFGTNITNKQPLNAAQPKIDNNDSSKVKKSENLNAKSADATPTLNNVNGANAGNESEINVNVWDLKDATNELCVVDYVDDIIQSLYHSEIKYGNTGDYMDATQENINGRMRAVLLDWIVEVHRKFELLPPTLHLCINLLDRYLAATPVSRKKLQLTGCTCLWIAGKYHEIYAPEVDDFVYISDNAFTREELISLEGDIVSKLGFELTVPTPLAFGQRYIKFATFNFKKENEQRIVTDLVNYCVEHSLIDYELSQNLPSVVAAFALCYAVCATKIIHNKAQWNHIFVGKFGIPHCFETLLPLMERLDVILKRTSKDCKHKSVRKKYTSSKLSKVALMSFSKLNLQTFA